MSPCTRLLGGAAARPCGCWRIACNRHTGFPYLLLPRVSVVDGYAK